MSPEAPKGKDSPQLSHIWLFLPKVTSSGFGGTLCSGLHPQDVTLGSFSPAPPAPSPPQNGCDQEQV